MMNGRYSNAPCIEEGYKKISITLIILVEFWWFHFFMKLKSQRWIWRPRCLLILAKRNFGKKMKSPSSMKNGRLNTSKCRGKLQKMGVLYTHSSKMPGPSPNFQKK
jgi:hypothetical protein